MAAIITQSPADINAAYAPNVYVVNGLTTEDRYVLEVYIGGNQVAKFKQPANPSGYGIFDISRVLQSYLKPTSYESTEKATDTFNAFLTYNIEAYLEVGQTETGARATGANKTVINSYANWREVNANLTAFKPNPTSVLCETNSNVNAVYANPLSYLTNYPGTYKVRPDEYKTLSFLSRNYNVGPLWGPNEAPFFVVFTYYLDGSQIAQGAYPLSNFFGSTLRADCQDMTTNLTDNNAITTIGVGPQNQADDGITGNWDSYKVEVYSYNHCITTTIIDCSDVSEILSDGYLGDVIYTANFEIDNSCEKFEPITVSFMNQYGVLDYYTFTKRNTKQVNTQRNNYTKALGSWSSNVFTINDTERGRTVFSSYSDTEMTLSTDWMDDATSEWLQELFVSPYTNIYVNGQWEPVTLITTTYEEKTYSRNQLFQHEVTVRFANNQKIQRG